MVQVFGVRPKMKILGNETVTKKTLVHAAVCILVPLILLPLALSKHEENRCAFVLLLVSAYWVLEPIPMGATSLLPIVLFPFLSIMSTERTSNVYMTDTSIVFVGMFMMAIAVEDAGLHRRIALKGLSLFGQKLEHVVLGVIVISCFISLFLNNVTVVAMMIPIVDILAEEIVNQQQRHKLARRNIESDLMEVNGYIPIKHQNIQSENAIDESQVLEEISNAEDQQADRIRIVLFLAMTYGSHVGTIGTITSAASNFVFQFVINDEYHGHAPIDYVTWILYAMPVVIVCIVLNYIAVWFMFFWKRPVLKPMDKQVILNSYQQLGRIKFQELSVITLFILLIVFCIFRDPLFCPGWATLFPKPIPKDATALMFLSTLLFIIPRNPRKPFTSPALLEWTSVQKKLPWSVILLIGGSFALAEGIKVSGLSKWVGNKLTFAMSGTSLFGVIAFSCVLSSFISEIISNAGTVTILLPILAKLAEDMRIDPFLLMIPSTLVSNFVFLLPPGTPSNALIYEHTHMSVMQMFVPGVVIKTITLIVAIFLCYFTGGIFFETSGLPQWVIIARNQTSI